MSRMEHHDKYNEQVFTGSARASCTDGFGWRSRILTTLLLLRAGYAYVPYSSLESVIEQSKEAYYLALRQTQGTIRTDAPDWGPWLEFFLNALQRQMHRLRQKVEREKLMMGALPELSARLIDLVRDQGRMTIGEAEKLTQANRNTLKQHFRSLVADGHLVLNGAGRGAWYCCNQVEMSVALQSRNVPLGAKR